MRKNPSLHHLFALLLVIATAIHAGKISAAPIAPSAACARLLTANQIAIHEAERISAVTRFLSDDYPILKSKAFRQALESGLNESLRQKYAQPDIGRGEVRKALRELRIDRASYADLLHEAAVNTWRILTEKIELHEPTFSLKGYTYLRSSKYPVNGSTTLDASGLNLLTMQHGSNAEKIWNQIDSLVKSDPSAQISLENFSLTRKTYEQLAHSRNSPFGFFAGSVWLKILFDCDLELTPPSSKKIAARFGIDEESVKEVRSIFESIEQTPALHAAALKLIEEAIYRTGDSITRNHNLNALCYLGACFFRGTTPKREIARSLSEAASEASTLAIATTDRSALDTIQDTSAVYGNLRQRLLDPPASEALDDYTKVSTYGNDIYRAIHELALTGLAEKERLSNPFVWNSFLQTLTSGAGGRAGSVLKLESLKAQVEAFAGNLKNQRWLGGHAGDTLNRMQTSVEEKLGTLSNKHTTTDQFYREELETALRRIGQEREEIYVIANGAQAWLKRCEDAAAIIRDFQSHLGPYGSGAFEGSTLMTKLETLRELLGYPAPQVPTKALGPKK